MSATSLGGTNLIRPIGSAAALPWIRGKKFSLFPTDLVSSANACWIWGMPTGLPIIAQAASIIQGSVQS